jgi:hypothetical protein
VKEGDDFKFKVSLDLSYSNSNIVVKANNDVLAAENGVYRILNVTSDIVITVEGVVENESEEPMPEICSIVPNSLQANRFEILSSTGVCEVEKGSTFVFAIQAKTGYKFGDNLVVRANGEILYPNNGMYTIVNVQGNVEISVVGIEELVETGTVTLPTGTDYIVVKEDASSFASTEIDVVLGEIFKFKVVTEKEIESVKAGEVVLTAENGVYSFVVSDDTVILVEVKEEQSVSVAYEFDLVFDDLWGEVQNAPDFIAIEINEDAKFEEVDAREFKVLVGFEENEVSIIELIDEINLALEDLSGEVDYFALNGVEFIKVQGSNVLINWDIIAEEGGSFELQVVVKHV